MGTANHYYLKGKKQKTMKKDSHQFVQEYSGLGAFGMGRETDEETVMFYLQKFSEDHFLKTLLPRLSDQELGEVCPESA